LEQSQTGQQSTYQSSWHDQTY